MRRQVITAAVLGLALATTSLPALAGGGDLNGSVDTVSYTHLTLPTICSV